MLPIYLSGCRRLLVIAGPTYVSRVWCMMELFTWVKMGGDMHRVTIIPISADNASLAQQFREFDVRRAQCFTPEEKDALTKIIADGFGGYHVFNRMMRVVFGQRILKSRGDDVEEMKAHEKEVAGFMSRKAGQVAQAVSIDEMVNTSFRDVPPFVIDPRSARMRRWELVTAAALIFTATVTPVEVAFLPPPSEWSDALFVTNRVVDVIFSIDVGLNFFLMFPSGSTVLGTTWVTSHGDIARHYLCGWFFLDAISVLASLFDIWALVDTESSGVSTLKALRVVRALRLLKLVRLLRASRIYKNWEARIAVDYSALTTGAVIIGLLLAVHWFACVWGLQATFQEGETWMHAITVCAELHSRPDYNWTSCGGPEGKSPGELYLAALLWSVGTVTGSASDNFAPSVDNWSEQLVAALLTFFGSLIWVVVIAVGCTILTTMHPDGIEFRANMDALNSTMRRHALPQPLAMRLRSFFQQLQHLRRARKQLGLLRLSESCHLIGRPPG